MLQKMQRNTCLILKVHVMISTSLKTMLHVDYSYKLCEGILLNGIVSLIPNSITSWDVLEDSFAEKFIPKVHSYVFVDVLNVVSHPPSPIWKQDNEVTNFEEESNQILDEISKSSHVVEDEDENSKLQEENFSLLYTPYEDISSNKFENEIKEPPPNTREDFILATEDENLQEHLQQEELVKEMNLEKNDEQDCLYKKEESFQDIIDESRTLEVVGDKEKYECILCIENSSSNQRQ
jgi:hypothetical protein